MSTCISSCMSRWTPLWAKGSLPSADCQAHLQPSTAPCALLFRQQLSCVHATWSVCVQVTDGQVVLAVDNGVAMLPKITATGCSVTALIAGFVAAAPADPMTATAAALAVFG